MDNKPLIQLQTNKENQINEELPIQDKKLPTITQDYDNLLPSFLLKDLDNLELDDHDHEESNSYSTDHISTIETENQNTVNIKINLVLLL